jgi:hypothetical protein
VPNTIPPAAPVREDAARAADRERDAARDDLAEHQHPRRLLRATADIQAGIPPDGAPAYELAEKAVSLAGPLAGRLVEYPSEHGPASASDESMLRQIGASRQRASQLMHQLYSAGLLQTVEQAKEGRPSRPARRFTIKAST